MNWGKFARSWRWNRKYRDMAIAIIKEQKDANDGGGMIEAMEDDFWRDSKIPKPPQRSDFIRRGKIDWSMMIGINGFILIVLALSFIAMTALIHF